MKLVNVRLGPEDARMAARLRKDGVLISRVVRDAIRSAYERRGPARAARRRPRALMADIYREYPDPPELSRSGPSGRDRRRIRRTIQQRLRRRRR